MFNSKKCKISELEYELNSLKSKHWDKVHELERLKVELEKLKKEDDSTPSDCTRGPWCESCEFSKAVTISTGFHGYFSGQETLYFCDRGRLCKNYKEKVSS